MKITSALLVLVGTLCAGACSQTGAAQPSPLAPTPSSPVTTNGDAGSVGTTDRSAACARYAEQLRQAVESGRTDAATARRLYNARCGETTRTR